MFACFVHALCFASVLQSLFCTQVQYVGMFVIIFTLPFLFAVAQGCSPLTILQQVLLVCSKKQRFGC